MPDIELMERVRNTLQESKEKALQEAMVTIRAVDLDALLDQLAAKPAKTIVMANKNGQILEDKPKSNKNKIPRSMAAEPRKAQLLECLMERLANPTKSWQKCANGAGLEDKKYMWFFGRLQPHETQLRITPKGEATRAYIEKWFGTNINVTLDR